MSRKISVGSSRFKYPVMLNCWVFYANNNLAVERLLECSVDVHTCLKKNCAVVINTSGYWLSKTVLFDVLMTNLRCNNHLKCFLICVRSFYYPLMYIQVMRCRIISLRLRINILEENHVPEKLIINPGDSDYLAH